VKKPYKAPVIRSESVDIGVFGCYGIERTGPLFGTTLGLFFTVCCGDNSWFNWP
jgi:hypothetical protein